ncbi:MAG: 30S ribosomal protein S18 [Candidatus Moeniiplasma glomeromycotorum]|nr:30S ribosomal protein S18 [Candidatus Moeniiplasma glomeromycotorum]
MIASNLSKKSKSKKIKISPYTDYFCQKGIEYIDYKDTNVLQKFINSQLRIIPQSKSKLIRKNHRRVAVAIKSAREMVLLPYSIVEQNEDSAK